MLQGKIIMGVAIFCFLLSSVSYAQNEKNNERVTISTASKKMFNGKRVQSTLGLEPSFSFKAEYANAVINFLPERDLQFAGDLNKDGYSDFFFSVIAADEETPELEDLITKMSIYYGSSGGLDITDNDIIRDNFSFIADINGDSIPESIKYIDDALYLVNDESLGEFTQLIETEILDLPNISITDIFAGSYGDLNGDGFNDIIVYDQGLNHENQIDFYVVYGANDFNNVQVDTLTYDANPGYDRIMFNDLDSDGTVEIVMVSNLFQGTSAGLITISQIDADTLKEIEQVELSSNIFPGVFPTFRTGGTGLADLNGDGNQELILEVNSVVTIFQLSSTLGEFYSESNISPTTYEGDDFSIIGDYNDDGSDNLLIEADTLLLITSDVSLNLTSSPLIVSEDEELSLIASNQKNRNSGGDVNGDGIDDITVEFSNSSSYGYRVYFGNSSGDFSTSDEITYSNSATLHRTPNYTFNPGDLNEDGIDDFGIVYNEGGEARIFFGGMIEDNQTPDLVIGESRNAEMFAPSVGDFNGDDIPDLVIADGSSPTQLNDSELNIYFGGAGMDTIPDYSLAFSTAYPALEIGEINNAASIGDINMDGYDDIMFISVYDQQDSHILYGGETMSATSDLVLPFLASNISKVGDFNDDGLNDFAVSILNTNDNEVRLFSGFDQAGGEIFNETPFLIFRAPTEGNYGFFGQKLATGDLDGDDISDLVIGSFSHQNNSGKGMTAIHIYKGGAAADSIADGSIALTKQLYGEDDIMEVMGDTLHRSVGSLTIVPDQNGDDINELLFSSGVPGYLTNAAIYFGGDLDTLGTTASVIFEAPNQSVGLGVQSNFIIGAQGTVAVGDFDGDDINDFVFTQGEDPNFLVSPVYIYSSNEFTVSTEKNNDNPSAFKLSQNYPNPFNPTTNISYSLPTNARVKLVVYDVLGRVVSTLVDKQQTSGTFELNLNGSAWASGVYFYRLEAGDFLAIKKFTLIK